MAFALTLGLAVTVRHIGTSPALLVELSLALEAKLTTPTCINFPSVFFFYYSGAGTQGFLYARQGFYLLSYVLGPYKEFQS